MILHVLLALLLTNNPAAYDRLAADPNVPNPLTATDAQVAQYADHYFEYDGNRKATKVLEQGGSRTIVMSYQQSANAASYNSWAYKTTESLPDGSQNIVYGNYAGQTMLRVLISGGSQWCDYYQYSSNGWVVLQAAPSAVSGYDEQYADLLHQVAGNYQYLNDNTGLIRTWQYHAPTGFVSGQEKVAGTVSKQ